MQTLLRESLSKGLVEVTFIKKDGTERVMICTRNLDIVPEYAHPTMEFNDREDFYRVYDVEKDGWRSFNEDQVVLISAQ